MGMTRREVTSHEGGTWGGDAYGGNVTQGWHLGM